MIFQLVLFEGKSKLFFHKRLSELNIADFFIKELSQQVTKHKLGYLNSIKTPNSVT